MDKKAAAIEEVVDRLKSGEDVIVTLDGETVGAVQNYNGGLTVMVKMPIYDGPEPSGRAIYNYMGPASWAIARCFLAYDPRYLSDFLSSGRLKRLSSVVDFV